MIIKITVVSAILFTAGLFMMGVLPYGDDKEQTVATTEQVVNNVSTVDGKQIITIKAKGNYSPKVTNAKAETPTVIKMNTQGTFDCTAALTIPSLGINKNLLPSAETEIEIPPQKAGTTMNGICGMGMYNFKINFN